MANETTNENAGGRRQKAEREGESKSEAQRECSGYPFDGFSGKRLASMKHSSSFFLSFGSLVSAMAVLYACSSDATTTPTPPTTADSGQEASSGTSSGGPGTSSGQTPVDSGPPPMRCTADELAANDKTDGGTFEITFETGANPRQYSNRCVTVKVGTAITFTGSFVQHPLEPAGGDSPNPIPLTDKEPAGGKLTLTMSAAGTFGYRCTFHPSQMFGAIRVVP